MSVDLVNRTDPIKSPDGIQVSDQSSVYYTVGVTNDGKADIVAKKIVDRKARALIDERGWSSARITQRHPETHIVIDGHVYYEYDITRGDAT